MRKLIKWWCSSSTQTSAFHTRVSWSPHPPACVPGIEAVVTSVRHKHPTVPEREIRAAIV